MREFVSEDDLQTFEGWLKYQGFDKASISLTEMTAMRRIFEEKKKINSERQKVGQMRLKHTPLEHRYGVAIREQSILYLTLWVRRSIKGEFFIMMPRGDKDWGPHTSYHLDGALHMKSYNRKLLPPARRQPLTQPFRGEEHLGVYYGHAPKSVAAICDPTKFTGLVIVDPGILGPRHGGITIDLVEPNHLPTKSPFSHIVIRKIFSDIVPWIVITVGF